MEGDELHRVADEVEGVLLPVERVEVALDGGEVDGACGDGHADGVLLAGVAHVGGALEGDDARGDALAHECRRCLPLERLVERGHLLGAGARAAEPRDTRLDHIEPRRGHAHPPRREHAAVRRHDDGAHLQLGAERRRVHRAAAAAGNEHEVARVVAAPHRDELQRVDHVGVDEADDPVGELRRRQAERAAEGAERLLGGGAADSERATQEVVGVEDARDELRVGDGGLGAAALVAGRAGLGTCALRANANGAAGVDPGDRAAAGADLDDVDDGHHHRVAGVVGAPANLVLGGRRDLAVEDQRALGSGAADVEVDDVGLAAAGADAGRPDQAGGGAGLDHRDRAGAGGGE